MINPKLKTLLAVYEEKNFTKAAEKLGLTQPAVSHQIKELEYEYHTQIFVRKKGDVITTQTGELIINYAKRFLAMDEKLKVELRNSSQSKVNLKIGITHTAESNQTTEIISTFLKERPGLTVSIYSDSTPNLYKRVSNFELDFAVVDQKLKTDLISLPLDNDYLVCVVSNESPLVKKKMVTLDDLKEQNLILRLPTSSTRMLFDSTLESVNESIENFKVKLEVDNIATIKELIRKNVGVSILAKSACMYEVRKNKLTILPIEGLSLQRKNYLIASPDFAYPNMLQDISKMYTETNIDV